MQAPLAPDVYTHIPANLELPEQVQKDGERGITASTFLKMSQDGVVELTARLDIMDVPQEIRSHPLLASYLEMVTAARITRRLRVYQEVADSLFADANIKFRLFLETFGFSEDTSHAEMVLTEEELDAHAPPFDAWTYGFKD